MIPAIIRTIGIIVTLTGVFWYFIDISPAPFIACLTGILAILGTCKFKDNHKPSTSAIISQKKRDDLCDGKEGTLQLFWDRFASAFPGARGITWFTEPQDCIRRLSIILAHPLSFKTYSSPIWWWRGCGNASISNFQHLGGRKVLIDSHELVIEKIAAVNLNHRSKLFVYVELRKDKACGVYSHSRTSRNMMIESSGYAWEEAGLLDGRYIKREELDDGVAEINGITVNLDGKAELRVRYLSPYNFVISAHASDINHGDFDPIAHKLLNGILNNSATLSEFADAVRILPRHRLHY